MPYVSENSRRSPNSFGSSDSNVTLATKSDLPMLHIKRDTSRLQVIHRGPLRTVGAIISAYSRTWLTWQRWEIMGQSFDINQIVWILGYFSLTLLFGFINTPSIDQFTKTNVTIHRVSSLSVGQLPLIIGLAGKQNQKLIRCATAQSSKQAKTTSFRPSLAYLMNVSTFFIAPQPESSGCTLFVSPQMLSQATYPLTFLKITLVDTSIAE